MNISSFSVYGLAGSVYGWEGAVYGVGGGGGGVAAPTIKIATSLGRVEMTIPSISPGITKTVKIPDTENVYLTELAINVNKKVSNVKLTVSTLDSRAEGTEDVAGEAYHYKLIETENIEDEDINNVTIGFKVERSWMADKNIVLDTVLMNRYHNDTWDNLSTTKTGSDSSYAYYSAISPGFSHLAISGEKIVEVVVPPTTTPAPTTPAPTTLPPITPAPTPAPSTPIAKIGMALILIAGIAAGAYVFVKRRKV